MMLKMAPATHLDGRTGSAIDLDATLQAVKTVWPKFDNAAVVTKVFRGLAGDRHLLEKKRFVTLLERVKRLAGAWERFAAEFLENGALRGLSASTPAEAAKLCCYGASAIDSERAANLLREFYRWCDLRKMVSGGIPLP